MPMYMSDFFLLLALPLLLGLILLFIVIAIRAYIAGCFADIAAEKGFDERKYFWMPFLLGIVGYLMVIALPDRGLTLDFSESPRSEGASLTNDQKDLCQ